MEGTKNYSSSNFCVVVAVVSGELPEPAELSSWASGLQLLAWASGTHTQVRGAPGRGEVSPCHRPLQHPAEGPGLLLPLLLSLLGICIHWHARQTSAEHTHNGA